MKYSCLTFGEGGKDKEFLMALIPLLEEYHAKKWVFNYDNASGSSPEIILKQCQKSILGKAYDLILCFIDQDALKHDYPSDWKEQKLKLEAKHSSVTIIWQVDNAEDEYRRVLGEQYYSKHKLNKMAKQRIKEFKNSELWHKILKPIKDKEEKLEKLKITN
ncbi:MAG TPA: hypothetical protein P5096_04175 [Patescibacteria group bacterium]|nr:hypothetical protein [Patescibacteria group bacterium]